MLRPSPRLLTLRASGTALYVPPTVRASDTTALYVPPTVRASDTTAPYDPPIARPTLATPRRSHTPPFQNTTPRRSHTPPTKIHSSHLHLTTPLTPHLFRTEFLHLLPDYFPRPRDRTTVRPPLHTIFSVCLHRDVETLAPVKPYTYSLVFPSTEAAQTFILSAYAAWDERWQGKAKYVVGQEGENEALKLGWEEDVVEGGSGAVQQEREEDMKAVWERAWGSQEETRWRARFPGEGWMLFGVSSAAIQGESGEWEQWVEEVLGKRGFEVKHLEEVKSVLGGGRFGGERIWAMRVRGKGEMERLVREVRGWRYARFGEKVVFRAERL